jgi:hypothetical protein
MQLNNQKSKGGSHPPKNNITITLHNNKILTYSPKKNKAKGNPECSVLYPDTNSDSASGRSKGERLVSARQQIINNKKVGNKGKTYQKDS